MTQSAVAAKDLVVGRERRTDGLWTHQGLLDSGMLRVRNLGAPLSGAGLELHYQANTGYLQSYDRDAGAYTDLEVKARNLSLSVNAGGALTLPAGAIGTAALADSSVTTAKLAAQAASALLGSYVSIPTWSTTTNGVWVATPASVLVTPSAAGALIRIDWSVPIVSTLAGSSGHIGVGWDGAVSLAVSYYYLPNASIPLYLSGTYYTTAIPSGVHTVQLFVFNYAAGATTSIWAGINTMVFVTEQKR